MAYYIDSEKVMRYCFDVAIGPVHSAKADGQPFVRLECPSAVTIKKCGVQRYLALFQIHIGY